VFLAGGCQTVPALVQVYKPPETELSDVRFIEVETFNVAETVAKQSGENVSGPLKNELQKSKRFVVVDRVELKRVRELLDARKEGLLDPEKPTSEPLRLRTADAILRGNVVAYKCESSAAPTGARSGTVVHEVLYDPVSWVLHGIAGFRQDELVQLEGSVAITYQLVDGRSGIVRCSGEAIHSQRRLYVRQLASGGEQERLLRELMNQCVQDVVNKLVRHKTTEIQLFATGNEQVQEGIKHVRAGDWSKAQTCWESALARNPDNHAALFNLGLAFKAHLEFDRALECFRRAAGLSPCPLYTSTLEKETLQTRQERLNEIEFAVGGEKTNRGIAFARDGDWQLAEEVWHKAIQEQPNEHAAYFNLAIARREQGDLKEAVTYLTQANKIEATNALYRQELSRATARVSSEPGKLPTPETIVPVSAKIGDSP